VSETGPTRALAERLVEAAVWRMNLTELEAETTPEFEAWLAEPGSAAAWRQVDVPMGFLDSYASEPESVAVRAAALTNARRASVERQTWRDRWRTAGTIAATLAICVLAAGAYLWWSGSPEDYATRLGERRVVALSDGSRVSLDSNSEVTVRYSRTARELRLLRGQARFDVAHDVQRPFSVAAGDQKVIATGTAFNIDIAGTAVLVTLIEGHVVVGSDKPAAISVVAARHSAAPIELHAGQELAALAEQPPTIAPANIQRVTAWTNGQLMFVDESLATVVARVNRYTDTPIEIDDPKAARMKISGVFNTGDVAGFVEIITRFLPVEAVDTDSGKIVLKAKKS